MSKLLKLYTAIFIKHPIVTMHRSVNENLYSPHNSDSSSDKIDTKLYNKDTKNKLNALIVYISNLELASSPAVAKRLRDASCLLRPVYSDTTQLNSTSS